MEWGDQTRPNKKASERPGQVNLVQCRMKLYMLLLSIKNFFFTFFHFKKMLFVLISGLKIGEKGLVVPPHRPPRPLCSAAPEVYITVDEDEH